MPKQIRGAIRMPNGQVFVEGQEKELDAHIKSEKISGDVAGYEDAKAAEPAQRGVKAGELPGDEEGGSPDDGEFDNFASLENALGEEWNQGADQKGTPVADDGVVYGRLTRQPLVEGEDGELVEAADVEGGKSGARAKRSAGEGGGKKSEKK